MHLKIALLLNTGGLYNKKEWKVKEKEETHPLGVGDGVKLQCRFC